MSGCRNIIKPDMIFFGYLTFLDIPLRIFAFSPKVDNGLNSLFVYKFFQGFTRRLGTSINPAVYYSVNI
jgi:hypothetical protein